MIIVVAVVVVEFLPPTFGGFEDVTGGWTDGNCESARDRDMSRTDADIHSAIPLRRDPTITVAWTTMV
jgi:hypothetical protein